MQKGKKTIIKSSFILGLGTFLAKILGAIYRIPLTALIGGTGLGLYQMIFPVYTVLLDFSGAGVPNALAKIIAEKKEEKDGYGYFLTAVRFFALLGLVGSIIMAVFAKPFSALQGNKSAYLGYMALSPAILLVSLISCFRGFFQGKMNMFPTALSQIIEQIIKLGVGLLLVYLFVPDIKKAVAGATLAISISELVAFLQLLITLKKRNKKNFLAYNLTTKEFKENLKKIMFYAVPVTLIGIILPLSQILDSFLALNLIGKYTQEATALYGILSGVGMTIINLPVAVCYGISAVAVPFVSSAKGEQDRQKKAQRTLLLTFLVATPCAICCYFLSPLIIKILFSSLTGEEYKTAVLVVKILAPAVMTLALIQTQNAVFIGKGKPHIPIIVMTLGVLIKILIESALYPQPKFNIYGGAIAVIACYFFISLVNLFIMAFMEKDYASKKNMLIERAIKQ